ncbi:MAG: hypothetical protein ACJ77A_06100 [Actinomycetota bacterium]
MRFDDPARARRWPLDVPRPVGALAAGRLDRDEVVDPPDDERREELDDRVAPESSSFPRTRLTISAAAAMPAVASPNRRRSFGPRRFLATFPILGAAFGRAVATFPSPAGTFPTTALGTDPTRLAIDPDLPFKALAAVPNAAATTSVVRRPAASSFVGM